MKLMPQKLQVWGYCTVKIAATVFDWSTPCNIMDWQSDRRTI